jgi:hypothetical protein
VFPDYFAAKEWAQLTEARLIEQKYLPHRVASHHTFDEAVQRYCAEILRWRAPSTIQKRTQTLKW